MNGRSLVFGLSIAAAATVVGCAPSDARFSAVDETVAERTGFDVAWTRGSAEDAAVADFVDDLLGNGHLTVDEAAQVALLSNRRLQATYETLGIARGELIHAGLPDNPVVSDEIRFFDEGTEHEAAVTEDLISIFTIPLRRRRDGEQLEATANLVADAAVHVIAETRRAYVDYQSAKQLVELLQQVVQATESSYMTAERLREAGNVKQLDVLRERALYEEAKVALSAAVRDLAMARERLNGVMGVWGPQAAWETPVRLPEVPVTNSVADEVAGEDAMLPYPRARTADGLPGERGPNEEAPEFQAERIAGPPTNEQVAVGEQFFTDGDAEALSLSAETRFAEVERLAIERNLHLAARRHTIAAQSAELDYEVITAMFPFLDAGVVPTWTAMDEFAIGPVFSTPVPTFDFGQAAYAREASTLRHFLEDYAAMAVEIRAAARSLEAQLQSARARAAYQRDVVLPLRAAVVAEAQLNYNAMTLSPFELLVAKRQQIEAAVQYVTLLRDYWHVRASMEQLLDGGMPPEVDRVRVGGNVGRMAN